MAPNVSKMDQKSRISLLGHGQGPKILLPQFRNMRDNLILYSNISESFRVFPVFKQSQSEFTLGIAYINIT